MVEIFWSIGEKTSWRNSESIPDRPTRPFTTEVRVELTILLENVNHRHDFFFCCVPLLSLSVEEKNGKPALSVCAPDLKHYYSSKYSAGHLSANCKALVKNKMEIQISK